MNNKRVLSITYAVFISAIIGKMSIAQDMFKDNFSNNEQWRYIADDVMGGVSTGNVEYINQFWASNTLVYSWKYIPFDLI